MLDNHWKFDTNASFNPRDRIFALYGFVVDLESSNRTSKRIVVHESDWSTICTNFTELVINDGFLHITDQECQDDDRRPKEEDE